MTGTKIVVIVLVLIVVLFIVLAVWAPSTNASAPKTNEDNFNPGQYPCWAHSMSARPLCPKLDLAKKTFDLTSTNPPHRSGSQSRKMTATNFATPSST